MSWDDLLYFMGYTLDGAVIVILGTALGVSLTVGFVRALGDVFYWARSRFIN